MKYSSYFFAFISMFFTSNLFAETLVINNGRERVVPAISIPPYAGVDGGLSQIALNGQINQLMPNFCVFYQPGQQNPICQFYWDRTVHNIAYGSPKIAYCENLQYELNTTTENDVRCTDASRTACYQFIRDQIQANLSNFCGD